MARLRSITIALLAMFLSLVDPVRAEDPCQGPSSMKVIRDTLGGLSDEITMDASESRAALARLGGELACAPEIVPPELLSDFFYLQGVAELVALDEVGALDDAGRARAGELLRLSLHLDPYRTWDRSRYTAFGEDVFSEARRAMGASAQIRIELPSGVVGGVWLNGTKVGDTGRFTWPGRQLLQWSVAGGVSGKWIDLGSSETVVTLDVPAAPTTPPVEAPRDPPAVETRTPTNETTPEELGRVRLMAQTWAFPMAFAGPEASVRVGIAARPYFELGAGAAVGPMWECGECAAVEGVSWLIPVRLEGGIAVMDRPSLGIDAGLAWQAVVGGAFGTADEIYAGTAARQVGGPMGALGLRWTVGAVAIETRLAGGWVVAPASFQGRLLTVGLGVGRAVSR